MLRPQSGSEHALTDPVTSLCCLAPVLRCMFCVETKHVFLSVLGWHSGMVLFYPVCAGSFCRSQTVQADFLVFASHPMFSHSRWSIKSFESCDSNVCQQCCSILDRASLSSDRPKCATSVKASIPNLSDDNIQKESTLSLMSSLWVDRHLLRQNE